MMNKKEMVKMQRHQHDMRMEAALTIKQPIRTRLRDLASQEGCDGEPYDTMQEASDYIKTLEDALTDLYICANKSKFTLDVMNKARKIIRDI